MQLSYITFFNKSLTKNKMIEIQEGEYYYTGESCLQFEPISIMDITIFIAALVILILILMVAYRLIKKIYKKRNQKQ
jgi:hypothetical protein